jgi:hypothetical protein
MPLRAGWRKSAGSARFAVVSAGAGEAEHAAALFVLQHAGLGRLAVLGRIRAERVSCGSIREWGLAALAGFDAARFPAGSEWAYRRRDDAPSERVRVLKVQARQNSGRADIEFLDDREPRRAETVPASRLRVPWDQVDGFDEVMANWARLDDVDLDEAEQAAVEQVYLLLIPDRVAEWEWSPVRFATAVHDREALAAVLGVSLGDIVGRCESFELDSDVMLSPSGSLLVAEAACRAAPMPVLDWIINEEKQIRERVKRGGRRTSVVERKEVETSPEWEYHWYRAHHRPVHELLRQWCGHRAVTFQERLIAAATENHRLDVLVAELIDALRQAGPEHVAAAFEEEHERDRVTAPKARPVIDRPLEISEIPVRYLPARRSWPR